MTPTDHLEFFLQVQDSRVFGSEPSTLTHTANMDLHQGFLMLHDFLMDGLRIQAGRMEVSYGTQRMIGAVGWNNVGRSFDGIRVTSSQPFGSVDVFALNTRETSAAPGAATPATVAYAREGGQFLGGIYATLSRTAPVLIDVFVLYESDRNQSITGTNDLARYTLGGYGRGEAGMVWYQAEAAYQLGKVSTRDLSAYLLSGMAGVMLSKTGVQRIGVGADILSGTPSAATTEMNTFIPAYHTGHKFYGFMDYFVGIPSAGLHDYMATVRFTPKDALTVDATAHLLRYAESTLLGFDLGTEVDVVASWRYDAHTVIEFGASAFLPGVVMKAIYGATDPATWGYAQVQVSL